MTARAAMPYAPSRLLKSGHAMTVASALADGWRRPALPPAEERRFRTAPGTEVLGLWHPPPHPSAPVAIVLHGLTGDARAGYVRGVSAQLIRRGFGVLRLNARNQGGTEHLTDTLFHAGLTTDVRAVTHQLIAEGHPALVLVGFSMGGNVALKAAGEWGADAPPELRGVAAVSPPVRLAEASATIERPGMNTIYQRSFMAGLRRLLKKKAALFPDRFDARDVDRVRSIRLFDDRYVAPAFGFSGADDYYARASADAVLDRLARPALVVHAADDSIVPKGPLEAWALRKPDCIQLELLETGGHVGFVQGRRGARATGSRFWAEARVADFALEQTSSRC